MADKIVEYHEWCYKCKNCKTKETEEPCTDCLDQPVNDDSHRPVYFEEMEGFNCGCDKKRKG